MRSRVNRREVRSATWSLEERVPQRHPLRRIRSIVDEALESLSPRLEKLRLPKRLLQVAVDRLTNGEQSLVYSLYRTEIRFKYVGVLLFYQTEIFVVSLV